MNLCVFLEYLFFLQSHVSLHNLYIYIYIKHKSIKICKVLNLNNGLTWFSCIKILCLRH